jgi:hypothetical protein
MALGEWGVPIESLPGGQQILGASGAWDDLGDLVVIGPRKVTAKFALTGTTWAAVDTALDSLRAALFDQRDYLYAIMGEDVVATRQALARCIALDVPYKYDSLYRVIGQATFEMLQPHWDAISLSTETKNDFDFEVDGGDGNFPASRTLVVRLHGPIVDMKFDLLNNTNGMSFHYEGSEHVHIGHYLDVDCGALTVLYDGVTDRYQYFSIPTYQMGFMSLEPGVNLFSQIWAPYSIPGPLYDHIQIDFSWREAYL